MKQCLLIAILFAAICSCTKEDPIPATGLTVPIPWKPNGLTPQTSTFTATQATDCTHVPPAPPIEKPAQRPVCKKPGGGNGGGGGDDSCCRLAPPVTPLPPTR